MNEATQKLLLSEISAINATLRSHGIDAGTTPRSVLIGGRSLILYRIKRGRGVKIGAVAGLLRELTEAISGNRHQRTAVRLNQNPLNDNYEEHDIP